jgi:hypothetical protein
MFSETIKTLITCGKTKYLYFCPAVIQPLLRQFYAKCKNSAVNNNFNNNWQNKKKVSLHKKISSPQAA